MSAVRDKVTVGSGPNPCWDWFEPLAVPRTHYAYIQFPNGQQVRVHRIVAWASHGFSGSLSSFQHVHHTCGNRNCVNPDHLVPLPARANLIEASARKHLSKRADDLTRWVAAPVPSRGLGEERWSRKERTVAQEIRRQEVDRTYQLIRSTSLAVIEACRYVGISEDNYNRGLSNFFPERTGGPSGLVARAVIDKDANAFGRVLVENTKQVGRCRLWTGTKQNGYASWGSSPHRYVHRVSVLFKLGCPTEETILPQLWRNTGICRYKECVNPDHWELITGFMDTVRTDIQEASVLRIRQLTDELAGLNPSHPSLRDGWETYLPNHLLEMLRH